MNFTAISDRDKETEEDRGALVMVIMWDNAVEIPE
jgi:hypothetical protein